MKCNQWYLDNKYQSKEDCLSQQNRGQSPTQKSTVTFETEGFIQIETGDTTASPNAIFSAEEIVTEADPDEIVTEEAEIWFPIVDGESDSSDEPPPDTTTSMNRISSTSDVTTDIFTAEEVFSEDKIEVQDMGEDGNAQLRVEFGGLNLGLAISGTAVGVCLLVGGLIKLGDLIVDKFLNRNDLLDGDQAERSGVPLTAVQPTAPEDSREDEETVVNFKTACESTLVEGVKSGEFTPPFSPIKPAVRTSSLPNVHAGATIGQQQPMIERTQSTIIFNLDDTVGGEFDAIANRNQPTQMDLSRLIDLPSTSQIFRDVERKEQERDSDVSGTSSAGQSDAGGRRKSTRVKKQFKPTQYHDLCKKKIG